MILKYRGGSRAPQRNTSTVKRWRNAPPRSSNEGQQPSERVGRTDCSNHGLESPWTFNSHRFTSDRRHSTQCGRHPREQTLRCKQSPFGIGHKCRVTARPVVANLRKLLGEECNRRLLTLAVSPTSGQKASSHACVQRHSTASCSYNCSTIEVTRQYPVASR